MSATKIIIIFICLCFLVVACVYYSVNTDPIRIYPTQAECVEAMKENLNTFCSGGQMFIKQN